MRTLVIGDIHGCATALKTVVEMVDLQADDTLITLGDYVDRGPDSKAAVDYLISLQDKCKLITLKGNHEQLMEMACETRMDRLMWTNVGGLATLISYGVTNPNDIPQDHWAFYQGCQLYHETETHIFVHGGLIPDVAIEKQDEEALLWLRIEELEAHQSGKIIVCGHTPQEDCKILDIGHAVCIDTHVFDDGCLTCLNVDTGEIWQAAEAGSYTQTEMIQLKGYSK